MGKGKFTVSETIFCRSSSLISPSTKRFATSKPNSSIDFPEPIKPSGSLSIRSGKYKPPSGAKPLITASLKDTS
jgi:hypothetical protein